MWSKKQMHKVFHVKLYLTCQFSLNWAEMILVKFCIFCFLLSKSVVGEITVLFFLMFVHKKYVEIFTCAYHINFGFRKALEWVYFLVHKTLFTLKVCLYFFGSDFNKILQALCVLRYIFYSPTFIFLVLFPEYFYFKQNANYWNIIGLWLYTINI